MQGGQPQETLEEDALSQSLCLGPLYNQSLDVGCPGKVLVAKAIPEGGW